MDKIILIEKIEQLFQKNWTSLVDRGLLIRRILEDVRDAELQTIRQPHCPKRQPTYVITKFTYLGNSNFEVWIEFTVPKDEGVVVGTLVYKVNLDGYFDLQEIYGTFFLPES